MDDKKLIGRRFAIYARVSSDIQNVMRIDAQIDLCRKEIANQSGVVVAIFYDNEANELNRKWSGFSMMCMQAEKGDFDAVMVTRFDHFATNYSQSVIAKTLLRQVYGVKLYCVEGFSQDDDDSPLSGQLERLLDIYSEFFQRQLGSETTEPIGMIGTDRLLSLLFPKSTKNTGGN